jgi:hypothetical protein
MRRAITEWGLVFSLGLLAACGFVWFDSMFLKYFREPLALGTDIYVRADDGRLCFFSELGADWKPRITVFEPRAISWARIYSTWMFPGIEYHNRLFANGRTVWSLEISLVIPVAVLLTLIAILWRVNRGGWLRRRPAAV